jgi:hypothetical protein
MLDRSNRRSRCDKLRVALLLSLLGCGHVTPATDAASDTPGSGGDADSDGPSQPQSFALTVAPTGGAAGARVVTSGDSAIDCGATCAHSYASGTQVTLTATAITGKGLNFQSWTGDCAASANAPTCTLTMNQPHSVGATFAPVNYLFISAGTFDTSTGVVGGDTLCQTEATTRGFPDANHYIAWLSVSGTPARDRIQTARGWVRLDGLPVLDSPSETTHILYPPRLGSLGQDLTSARVVTGTDADGSAVANCLSFTSNTAMQSAALGRPGSGAGGWTNAFNIGCDSTDLHVYCLGTQSVSQIAPPAVEGRLAFASDGVFDPSSGRASADALCQSEATTHGFPGHFLALMSLLTEAASQRFDTTGPPWVRRDGVQLTARPSDLFAGNGLIAALDVTGTLAYLDHNDRIWTGSDQPNTSGMFAPTTCNNWSDAGETGAVGAPDDTGGFGYYHTESLPCDTPHRVYCLQQ